MEREQIIWGLIAFGLGIAFGIVGLALSNRARPAPIVITPAPPPIRTPTPTVAPLEVYVSGAVVEAGVYGLPPGSRVEDALAAAGGVTAVADAARVNLAQPLLDGMQITVPDRVQATVTLPVVQAPVGVTGEGGLTGIAGPININDADKALLETLPRIGPSTAQKILDYRDDNGPFATVEEIMNVPGIGPATFAQLQDLITVAP